MSTSNTKKTPAMLPQGRRSPRAQHSAMQVVGKKKADVKSVHIVGIQGRASLGQGYLIIKMDPNMVPGEGKGAKWTAKALLDTSVPDIPLAVVRRLLAKFAEGPEHKRLPAKRAQSTKSGVAENQEFLTGLADQAVAARAKHVLDGTLLTPDEVLHRLAITRQAVSKAVRDKRMFWVDGPAGKHLYPAFFTDPKYVRRDVEKVSQALGDLPGPSKWQFFTTGKGSLGGRTPLVALAKGDIDSVLVAAAGFRER